MIKQLNEILSKNKHTDSPIEEILYLKFQEYGFKPVAGYDIFPFFIDLAFPEIKLAIEADGKDYHNKPEQKQRDDYRQKKLENLGWKFERFSGFFIYNFGDVVVSKILLKYFKDKLKPEQITRAVGRLVHYFSNGKSMQNFDIYFALKLTNEFLQNDKTI